VDVVSFFSSLFNRTPKIPNSQSQGNKSAEHEGIAIDILDEKESITEQELILENKSYASNGFIIINGVLEKYIGSQSEVLIPETVKNINVNAFNECLHVKSIIIPDSVTKIDKDTFSECKELTRIYMPESLEFGSLDISQYNKNLRIYKREKSDSSMNFKNELILRISKLIMEAVNIANPFSRPIQIDRLLEMDEELDILSDIYYVNRLKTNFNAELDSALKIIENRETFNLLKSAVQFAIGKYYFMNAYGERDKKSACNYFEMAAQNGNMDAKYNLACCYGMGFGVNKDEIESFRLMKQCAEAGIKEAAFTVGQQYLKGAGTKKDIDEAIKWFRKSAKDGNPYAYRILESLNANES
jgi:hypothetical protein